MTTIPMGRYLAVELISSYTIIAIRTLAIIAGQTENGNSSYALPPGADNNTYLAGSYNFTVIEIEVYQVIK